MYEIRVEFKSNGLAKQSKPSRLAAPFVFPAFTTDKNLCAKEALSEYVSRTEPFRGTGSNKKTNLSISNQIILFHPPPLLDGSWPCSF